jgi:hypothetical protein
LNRLVDIGFRVPAPIESAGCLDHIFGSRIQPVLIGKDFDRPSLSTRRMR